MPLALGGAIGSGPVAEAAGQCGPAGSHRPRYPANLAYAPGDQQMLVDIASGAAAYFAKLLRPPALLAAKLGAGRHLPRPVRWAWFPVCDPVGASRPGLGTHS